MGMLQQLGISPLFEGVCDHVQGGHASNQQISSLHDERQRSINAGQHVRFVEVVTGNVHVRQSQVVDAIISVRAQNPL